MPPSGAEAKSASESNEAQSATSLGSGLTTAASIIVTVLFLTRRWWRRLWVVQEYCLARDITFLLDNQSIDMEVVKHALDFGQSWKSAQGGEPILRNLPKWSHVRHSCLEMLQLRDE